MSAASIEVKDVRYIQYIKCQNRVDFIMGNDRYCMWFEDGQTPDLNTLLTGGELKGKRLDKIFPTYGTYWER